MNFSKLKENKIFLYLGSLMVIFVIIILIVGACSMMSGGRTNYKGLENTLLNAARDYYSDHQSELPGVLNEASVTDTVLSQNGYMKDISKIAPKGDTCQGKVVVKNTNGNYNYQAFVDCGDNYKNYSISDYIKNTENVVTSGDGLYSVDGALVYRGENPNNYMKFAGRTYRIVSVNSNGSLTIIGTDKTESDVWDDRYNAERDGNDGINNYSLSRLRDRLNTYVNSSSFSDSDRVKLEYFSVCIGKVSESQTYTRNIECSQVLDNQIIGVLALSSYLYASLDSGCINPTDGACQNYNYLSNYDYNWWTSTGDLSNTYKVYSIGGNGGAYLSRASMNKYFREVLTLASNSVYVSGNGTFNDPYVIK